MTHDTVCRWLTAVDFINAKFATIKCVACTSIFKESGDSHYS